MVGLVCSRCFCLFLTGMVKLLDSAVEGKDTLYNLEKKAVKTVEVLLSSRKTSRSSKKQKSQNKYFPRYSGMC